MGLKDACPGCDRLRHAAGGATLHQMRCVRSPKLKAKGIWDPLGQPTSYRADSRVEHDFKASFEKVLPTGERTE